MKLLQISRRIYPRTHENNSSLFADLFGDIPDDPLRGCPGRWSERRGFARLVARAQPYPYVSTGSFSSPAVPASPDPLVRYRWPKPQAGDGLEIYLRRPERVVADQPKSFTALESLLGANRR